MRSRSCSDRSPATARSDDDGTVTAEAAVALPVLLLALGLAVFVLVAVAAQVRCVDAARGAARLAARGEPADAVAAAGRALAPKGAEVTVTPGGEQVAVEVSADVRAPGSLLARLGAVTVTGRAVARVEPGVQP